MSDSGGRALKYWLSWPKSQDGDWILPGDVVKIPGCKSLVHVVSVGFGGTGTCSYINGFKVLAKERVERVRRGPYR